MNSAQRSRPAPRGDPTRGGFTLIELLAVVSVGALLAALVLPALSGTRSRAEANRARAELVLLASALERQRVATGSYPGTGLTAHASTDPAQPLATEHAEAVLFAAVRRFALPLTAQQAGSAGGFLDPWGRRYLYYPPPAGEAGTWRGGAFVLFSAGPDGRAAGPDPSIGEWPADAASRSVNRDNLQAGTQP
jgi:general secretion pathway protein G